VEAIDVPTFMGPPRALPTAANKGVVSIGTGS
jgi:hypothetical protein